MLTPGELATFLMASAGRVRPEITAETKHLLDEAAVEAKAMIGQELPEWPPLAPSTIAEKQRLGYTGQVSDSDPLLRTGRLRDSITASTEATFEGAEGVLGSEDPVAADQELGTSRIPPRPFIAPSMRSAQARAVEGFGLVAMSLMTPPVR